MIFAQPCADVDEVLAKTKLINAVNQKAIIVLFEGQIKALSEYQLGLPKYDDITVLEVLPVVTR